MAELTPNAVVSGLLELARELAALSKDLDEIEKDAVNKREDYTLAFSTIFLTTAGAMELRKHQATVDTHKERLAAETAEAVVKGRKRQLQTLLTRIDVGRSAAAALRAEMALS